MNLRHLEIKYLKAVISKPMFIIEIALMIKNANNKIFNGVFLRVKSRIKIFLEIHVINATVMEISIIDFEKGIKNIKM